MSKVDGLDATPSPATPRANSFRDDILAAGTDEEYQAAVDALIAGAQQLEHDLACAWENNQIINKAYCKIDEETRELRGSHFADANGGAIPAKCHVRPCNAPVSETRAPQCETRCALLDGDLATQRSIHDGYASSATRLTDTERVEKALRGVFGAWHSCAMGTRLNPLHEADKARGLKEGQLCDDCEGQIAAHLKDIFQ